MALFQFRGIKSFFIFIIAILILNTIYPNSIIITDTITVNDSSTKITNAGIQNNDYNVQPHELAPAISNTNRIEDNYEPTPSIELENKLWNSIKLSFITLNYTIHTIIIINSNQDFIDQAFPGNGSASNPFVIQGFNISGDGTQDLITITNTNSYYEISENYLADGERGIFMNGADNGNLSNNIVIDNNYGMVLYGQNINVTSNYIINSSSIGATLSINGIISLNNVQNAPIGLQSESWACKTITSNNITNADLGINLISTRCNTIEGNIISDSSDKGININSGSTNNSINSNKIILNNYGIFSQGSNNTIFNNIIANTTRNDRVGITLTSSSSYNNIIDSNIIVNNGYAGISVYSGYNNTIVNNNISKNYNGIYISNGAHDNIVIENHIFDNEDSGIDLLLSLDNTISLNLLEGNGKGIWLSASRTLISYNTITNNQKGIYLSRSNNTIIHNILQDIQVSLGNVEDTVQTRVENNTLGSRELIFLHSINQQPILATTVQQIVLINSSNIIISGKTITNGAIGIQIIHSKNITVNFNSFSDNILGMKLDYTNVSHISHNNFANVESGFALFETYDSEISYNNVSYTIDQLADGILSQWSARNLIKNNMFDGFRYGINLFESSDNEVEGNLITIVEGGINERNGRNNVFASNIIETTGSGIFVVRSDKTIIINNSITTSNRASAIGLHLRSSNMSIQGNRVTNFLWGMYLSHWDPVQTGDIVINNNFISENEIGIKGDSSYMNNVTIAGNELIRNYGYGISLVLAEGISVIGNNFIDNNPSGVSQAYAFYDNEFSHNYWSDWTSPNENNDEFVDISYIIKGETNNWLDDFPMVSMYGSPDLTRPANITIIEGIIGNEISWVVGDSNPFVYNITLDGTVMVSSTVWTNGTIFLSLDDLIVNEYILTLRLFNSEGYFNQDIVKITVIENILPNVSSPSDINYEQGTTGNTVSWVIGDRFPGVYDISLDGEILQSNISWFNSTVTINIDGLVLGVHTIEIHVYDIFGNSKSDIVEININEITSTTSEPQTSSTIPTQITSKTNEGGSLWIVFTLLLGLSLPTFILRLFDRSKI